MKIEIIVYTITGIHPTNGLTTIDKMFASIDGEHDDVLHFVGWLTEDGVTDIIVTDAEGNQIYPK